MFLFRAVLRHHVYKYDRHPYLIEYCTNRSTGCVHPPAKHSRLKAMTPCDPRPPTRGRNVNGTGRRLHGPEAATRRGAAAGDGPRQVAGGGVGPRPRFRLFSGEGGGVAGRRYALEIDRVGPVVTAATAAKGRRSNQRGGDTDAVRARRGRRRKP